MTHRWSWVGTGLGLLAVLLVGITAVAASSAPSHHATTSLQALTPVAVTLTVSPNPSAPADTLTFHVEVSPNPHGGYVAILSGATQLGTDQALGGNGTVDIKGFDARLGTNQIKACFLGTDTYAAGCSADVSHTVAKLPTTTTIAVEPSTIAIGDSFTVSVTVSPAPGTPMDVGITGGPIVRIDATGVGQSLVLPSWPYDHAGRYDLIAYFEGTLNLEASQSQPAQLTITAPEITSTTTTLSVTGDPVPAGDSTCVSATVSPPPGAGTVTFELTSPTGAVTTTPPEWTNEGTGTAGVCHDMPTAGTWSVVAKYAGDLGWLSSASDAADIEVVRRPTTTTVAGSDTQSTTQPFRVVVLVNDTGETVTGSVTLYETTSGSDVLIGTQPLDTAGSSGARSTTFEMAARAAGTYSFRASYSGTTTKFQPSGGTGSVTVHQGLVPGTPTLDGGASATTDGVVTVSAPATGAIALALSNDGSLWKVFDPFVATTPWSLLDPSYGGSSATGDRSVFVQWQDEWFSWSTPVSVSISYNPPTATVSPPAAKPTTGARLASGALPFTVSWSGIGSGIASYTLERSAGGGAWTTAASTATTSARVYLAPGATYQFRVRTVNTSGVESAWALGAPFKLSSAQQTSSRFSWSGTWTTRSSTSYWGGSTRYATAAGAKSTFKITGRSFAWISAVGPTRGSARVYVNGTLVKTVSLYAATASTKRVVFAMTWSTSSTRTITIKVVGTSGHPRVDVDGVAWGS